MRKKSPKKSDFSLSKIPKFCEEIDKSELDKLLQHEYLNIVQ